MERALIRDFAAEDIEQAGELLAARHRRHRLVEPLLAPRFEDPSTARAEVAALFQKPGVSGAVALGKGRMLGYVLGAPRAAAVWGPNVWIEPAGHAVHEAELARDLYAQAATQWVAEGCTAHYVTLPASDLPLVDAWFRVGFGQQHVHALQPAPAALSTQSTVGSSIRRATGADIDLLAELDLLLPEHQSGSPVFSAGAPTTVEEARAEWNENIDDPVYVPFVAEVMGRIVGSAVGCPVELSTAHSSLARPDNAALRGFVAVRPEARGRGIGRALGEKVLEWAREAGYHTVVTDWRATNLLASRAWTRLGFRPTFLRLFRAI